MDIHKPKAAANWREFAIEIGTIICGILIALTLEQLIELIHWRHEVAEAREGLSVELGTVMAQAEQRARNSVCVQRRLDELATVVDEAARTGTLRPMSVPNTPMLFIWGAGVWQSAVSNQTVTHFRRGELMGYSETYKFLRQVDEANEEEQKVWTTLYGLAGPGRRFEPAEAATYRQAIAQARHLDGYIGGMGVRAHQSLDAYHIGFDNRRYQKVMTRRIQDLPICKPMTGAPPLHYGAAPSVDFAERARANPLRPALQDGEQ
ncbi:MAG TPA: hypothetical protein VG407_08215 [Caulobacteraceae bacterium]|jgi:hypothetical protein|nr:hypothetical protein [Caulobacteraceae bacterium]